LNSPVSKFEEAVEAIVSGDLPALEKLLSENPDLVSVRSTREHRSTLLHYVSANGVEDFRQKAPKNIVAIAKLLLDAGADVNAESDAYGGRCTTLGLTATSCHPENAGVQIPLMELLIDRGAIIDGPDGYSGVNGCLHNGRGQAAEFLANRGARLDLEGAAGVGRLDVVQSFFAGDGRLNPPATPEQMKDGFAWACEFGRISVVEFLLQKGMPAGAKIRRGETGLHWAAYGGHSAIVQLLLDRGAPIDVKDDRYDGTPLDWALHEGRTDSRMIAALKGEFEVVFAALENYFAGIPQAPPSECGRRAAFQLFINREEMLDFVPDVREDLIDIADLVVAGIAVGYGQDFLIVFLAIDHLQHADRRDFDQASRKTRFFNQCITSSGSPSSDMVPGMNP